MKSCIPNFAVKSIVDTLEYYKEHFDAQIVMLVDESKSGFEESVVDSSKEYIWAMIRVGSVDLFFQREDSLKEDVGDFFNEIGSSSTYYYNVDDIDKLYNRLKDSVTVVKDIDTTWYGQKEFYIKDINGYVLGFAQRVI